MWKIAVSLKILASFALVVLSGCSVNSDYLPSAGATGEKIFKEACVQCHTPVHGNVMILRAEVANPDAIIERIKYGKGLGMPAFPNLTGESAQSVAVYILENSTIR